MEAINESTKKIASAIKLLSNMNRPFDAAPLDEAIKLLQEALNKLTDKM